MPPSKRNSRSYEADDFIDDDDAPKSKKARVTKDSEKSKKEPAKKKEIDLSKQKDKEGNKFWALSAGSKNSRRITVSEFKGQPLVSIREYYESNGEMLPGKKGISLTLDQFNSLISVLPDVEKQLSTMGATVPRPNYDKPSAAAPPSKEEDDEEGAEKDAEDVKKPRKNFEATSDEDEDE